MTRKFTRVKAIIQRDDGRILLGFNSNKNFWACVGGHCEPDDRGDNFLIEAMLREAFEEAGLTNFSEIKPIDSLGRTIIFYMKVEGFPETTVENDQDEEFAQLSWFRYNELPSNTHSETFYFISMNKSKIPLDFSKDTVVNGSVEVYVDGEKYGELRDDTIYLTLPKLAQLKSKGKKITFKQKINNKEIDQTPEVLPPYMVVDAEFVNKNTADDVLVEAIFEELQKKYFYQLQRPEIVFVGSDTFLGNTVFDPNTGRIQVQLHEFLIEAPGLLKQVMAHELIHAYLYQKYGEDVARHGEHFNFMAHRINQDFGDGYVAQFGETTKWDHNTLKTLVF
jgi:8-oxo-dGTP pyrophosphatase MutT (NUDIX family)